MGRESKPIVTTVAPTMPVDAAKNAPTTTTETAKPPGKGPKTLAIVVSRSFAILDLSKVMPIKTNIKTASRTSIDWPARTRSFIRLTINEMVLCKAVSQPPLKSGSTILGKSGYRKIEIWSNLTPEANNSLYMTDVVSMA